MRKLSAFIYMLIIMLVITTLLSALGISALSAPNSEETGTTYTVTFTRGYKFINTLTNEESNHLFSGVIPESITVAEGGSFIFPENTIVFSDYIFLGWQYEYTDGDGIIVSDKCQPGEVFENVTTDITVKALWVRYIPDSLIISGFISYNGGDDAVGDDIEPYKVTYGSRIKPVACPYTKEGFAFAGWVDSDGVFTAKDAKYTVTKINPTLTAVWLPTGEALSTHKVSYSGGEGEITGTGPTALELYGTNQFTVAVNTYEKAGHIFTCWQDADGNNYYPGDIIDFSASVTDTTVLTAVWKEAETAYTVHFNIYGSGAVYPAGDVRIAKDGSYKFSVYPAENYKLSSVSMNGISKRLQTEYNVYNMSADMTVDIVFEHVPTYNVVALSSEGGDVYIEGSLPVNEGGSITAFVTPHEGYELESVTVNGVAAACADGKIILDNITQDMTVSAVFRSVVTPPVSEEPSEASQAESSGQEESVPEPSEDESRENSIAESHPPESSTPESKAPDDPFEQSEMPINPDTVNRRYIITFICITFALIIGAVILKIKR